MGLTVDQSMAMQLFYPYAAEQLARIESDNVRFVHYTTAAVASSIIEKQEIWMRKSSTMNDFLEIDYGLTILHRSISGPNGELLRQMLDGVRAGLCQELFDLFDGWTPHFRTDTYLTCISEHLDTEDAYGRLSMWRAYGGTTGVALVLNNRVFRTASDALKAYTSPVAYFDQEQFDAHLSAVLTRVATDGELLHALGPDQLRDHLFNVFRFAVLCTKHPGFAEEKEWRIIYSPSYDKSERLIREIQVVRGTPQVIFKIPLEDVPEEGLLGLNPDKLLDKLIVGPTEYPYPMAEAFVDQLAKAGVTDAAARVTISDIPLRQVG